LDGVECAFWVQARRNDAEWRGRSTANCDYAAPVYDPLPSQFDKEILLHNSNTLQVDAISIEVIATG
jgi:hypothetical protein